MKRNAPFAALEFGASMLPLVLLTAAGIMVLGGPPFLLMSIAGQLGRQRIAVAVGLLATAFILYAMLDTYLLCSTPPVGIEAIENDEFACDVPFRFIPRIFIWFAGPIAAVLLLAATYFQYSRLRRDG